MSVNNVQLIITVPLANVALVVIVWIVQITHIVIVMNIVQVELVILMTITFLQTLSVPPQQEGMGVDRMKIAQLVKFAEMEYVNHLISISIV